MALRLGNYALGGFMCSFGFGGGSGVVGVGLVPSFVVVGVILCGNFLGRFDLFLCDSVTFFFLQLIGVGFYAFCLKK